MTQTERNRPRAHAGSGKAASRSSTAQAAASAATTSRAAPRATRSARTRRFTSLLSLKLTTSAGVAALQPGNTLDGWIAHADAALYRAKQDGRNRVLAD